MPSDALAKTVCAEAGGEPFDGMVGVAEVVLERVRDSRWPDTLEGVLSQPAQFSARAIASDECRAAAAKAISGSKLAGGANHFVNLDLAKPTWYDPAKVTLVVGSHTFLRR